MDGYAAPAADAYGATTTAEGNGWYGGEAAVETAAAPVEQQGFSIPTTGQSNGGGPMRRGGGASRFNPMSRGKAGGGDGAPATATGAEKNELGYIIFAYNIGYQTDESQLQGLFDPYGTVAKVNVIQDFATGQGKGFGFVTMPNAAEAEAAVNALNGSDYSGNCLQVRFKTPKGQGGPSGGRGGRGGSFRGGMRGGFRGGFRGGAPRGGGFRGGRGGPRGGGRGRGRGAYSSAPSAYDTTAYGGYGGGYDGYGAGYSDPSAAYGAYDYQQDPYAGYQAGTGYTSYGATGAPQW